MEPNTRLVYPDPRLRIRSFAMATFLHAKGHPILHVSPARDGKRPGDAEFFFPPEAAGDMTLYTTTMDHVHALAARATGHDR